MKDFLPPTEQKLQPVCLAVSGFGKGIRNKTRLQMVVVKHHLSVIIREIIPFAF